MTPLFIHFTYVSSRIRKESEAANSGATTTVWGLLTRPDLALPNLLNLTMHLASQLSGISAVYTYSTGFFREAGIPEAFATHSSAIVGGTMMAVTTVAVPLMGALGTRGTCCLGTRGTRCLDTCSIL